MNSRSRLLPLLTAVLPLLGAATPAALADSDDRTWEAEAGASVGYHDNFFFREDSPTTDAPSATLTRLYMSGGTEFEAGGIDWELFGSATANFVSGVDDADWQGYSLGAGGKWDKLRATLEAAYEPNRLFSEEGDGTFYDRTATALGGRYSLPGSMWLGAEYELTNLKFDSLNSDRDADTQALTATFRVPVGDRAALRFIGMIADKDARGPENSWEATGLGIALELEPAERWSVFARLRSRDREYFEAPADDSNFRRDDTILDALVNARVQVGERWGLGGQLEYRDSDSTRDDRNYDALVVWMSAYMTF